MKMLIYVATWLILMGLQGKLEACQRYTRFQDLRIIELVILPDGRVGRAGELRDSRLFSSVDDFTRRELDGRIIVSIEASTGRLFITHAAAKIP